MKETNSNTIEQALASYKASISPNREHLRKILSQIPEQKNKEVLPVKQRSPYMWLAITQVVMVCSIVFVLSPTLGDMYTYRNDPFYETDKQIAAFEAGIDEADTQSIMLDYNN